MAARKKVARRRRRPTARKTTRRRRTRTARGIPMPKAKLTLYAVGALIAGGIVGHYVDVPFLSEKAVGLFALAYFTKDKTTRETVASIAVALQVEQVLEEDVTPKIMGMLP